jgi:hypothetical protein
VDDEIDVLVNVNVLYATLYSMRLPFIALHCLVRLSACLLACLQSLTCEVAKDTESIAYRARYAVSIVVRVLL